MARRGFALIRSPKISPNRLRPASSGGPEPLRRFESLEGRAMMFDPAQLGAVAGHVWSDVNGDGHRDATEGGLSGVVIYADLNHDARLNLDEPHTESLKDDPVTDFDESGQYLLSNLPSDRKVAIRQVVPAGYQQTFPLFAIPTDSTTGPASTGDASAHGGADQFARVLPERIDLVLAPGEQRIETPVLVIDPVCIRPVTIDVRVDDPSVQFKNITGPRINGCGGDASKWEVSFTGDGIDRKFSLLFVDAESNSELARIPVTLIAGRPGEPGAHLVTVIAGKTLEGLDFGNQPVSQPTGGIQGRKWSDDDGDGVHDSNERTLANVPIYLDLNGNGRWDQAEPMEMTRQDDPATPADETGRYAFSGLRPGTYEVREQVPAGYQQTFPAQRPVRLSSETRQLAEGAALDLDLTGVQVSRGPNPPAETALEVTVVWPDCTWSLDESRTSSTIVGDQVVVALYAHPVQTLVPCPAVLTPQTTKVPLGALPKGAYSVVATLLENQQPAGFTATQVMVGQFDLGLNISAAHTVKIDGQIESQIDFGNQPLGPGSITGTQWIDFNGNARHDEGEPGLAGVIVYLDLNRNGQHDPDEPVTKSSDDDPQTREIETGQYRFAGLRAGSYAVRQIVPGGYEQTYPVAACEEKLACHDEHVVVVIPGHTTDDVDFGNRVLSRFGKVTGIKWIDQNGNDKRDEGERGLGGVTIYLDRNFDQRIDADEPQTVTRSDGSYVLEAPAGFYVAREVVPSGYEQTYPDEFLCDAVYCTGRGHAVNVVVGGELKGIDFGNRSQVVDSGEITGAAWQDQNQNGKWDPGELGLSGVRVYADLNLNHRLDRGEPTTETIRDDVKTPENEAGQYRLTELKPGDYVIRQVVPFGAEQTWPTAGIQIDSWRPIDFPGGSALSLKVSDFHWLPAPDSVEADGLTVKASITVTTVFPDSCGELDTARSTVKVLPTSLPGSSIRIQMFGQQKDGVCLTVLTPRSQTFEVMLPSAIDRLFVSAVLSEPGADGRFRPSIATMASLKSTEGMHKVSVSAGAVVSNVNFGNHRRAVIQPEMMGGRRPMHARLNAPAFELPRNLDQSKLDQRSVDAAVKGGLAGPARGTEDLVNIPFGEVAGTPQATQAAYDAALDQLVSDWLETLPPKRQTVTVVV